MDGQPLLDVSSDTNLGRVEISPEVIEVITGIAASEVEGVSEMRGSFATGVVERFGKKSHSKGVKVALSENKIIIDLSVVLKYGVSIPEVAQKLQANIKQTLINMLALEVDKVNIHVLGIETDETSMNDSDE